MKPNTLLFSIVLCCSCIVFMFLLYCNKSIIKSNAHIIPELEKSFSIAIELDSEKRLKEARPIITLGYRVLPDSLSHQNGIIIYTDKEEIFIPHKLEGISVSKRMSAISQTVMTKYNPLQTTRLDSIFRELLTCSGIQARTLVCYRFNGDTLYSSPDLKLLTSDTRTPEIATGIDNEIKLQAFIHYPPLERLKTIRTTLSILFTGLLIGMAYLFFRRKRTVTHPECKAIPAKAEQVPFPLETPCIPATTETFRVEDTRFDFIGNKLWINDKAAKLTKQNIKLLKALLQAPKHYLKREEIYDYMWNDYIRDYNKLNKCTDRLRETISAENPSIRIVTHHKRGIELTIVPYHETPLSPGKEPSSEKN